MFALTTEHLGHIESTTNERKGTLYLTQWEIGGLFKHLI